MVTPNRRGVTTLLVEAMRRFILKKGKERETKKELEVEVGVQERLTLTGRKGNGKHLGPIPGPSKCM
jgi:hypothetical protein